MNYREEIGYYDYKLDVRAKLCTYDLSGNFGVGRTAKGEIFYFDKEDYELIKDLPWHYSTKTHYVQAHVRINGKRPFILMHRLVMDAPQGLFVDHIGGNDTRNDNRKCNLRLATPSQNMQNAKPIKRKTLGAKGVRYHYKRWEATITFNGISHYLGSYKTHEEALKAREEAENRYYGEFSYNNSQEESKRWRVASV